MVHILFHSDKFYEAALSYSDTKKAETYRRRRHVTYETNTLQLATVVKTSITKGECSLCSILY